MRIINKIYLFFLFSIIVINFLLISSQHFFKDTYAHNSNSLGQKIGNYYVQVETDPDIPSAGKNTNIMIRVSSTDGLELSDVPISIEITKNTQVVYKIPQIVTNGHYEFNYKFMEPGNYVFYVYLQDIKHNEGNTITYTFNISTLNPFGYIFNSLISFAVITPFVVLTIIFMIDRRQKIKKKKMQENKKV